MSSLPKKIVSYSQMDVVELLRMGAQSKWQQFENAQIKKTYTLPVATMSAVDNDGSDVEYDVIQQKVKK